MHLAKRAYAQSFGTGADDKPIGSGVHVHSHHFSAMDRQVARCAEQRMHLGCGALDGDPVEQARECRQRHRRKDPGKTQHQQHFEKRRAAPHVPSFAWQRDLPYPMQLIGIGKPRVGSPLCFRS
jgi:hypothetical protein